MWQAIASKEQREALTILLQEVYRRHPHGDNRVLGRRNQTLMYARTGQWATVRALIVECSLTQDEEDEVVNAITLLS